MLLSLFMVLAMMGASYIILMIIEFVSFVLAKRKLY